MGRKTLHPESIHRTQHLVPSMGIMFRIRDVAGTESAIYFLHGQLPILSVQLLHTKRVPQNGFLVRPEYESLPECYEREDKKDKPGHADEDDHDEVEDVEPFDLEGVSEDAETVDPSDYSRWEYKLTWQTSDIRMTHHSGTSMPSLHENEGVQRKHYE